MTKILSKNQALIIKNEVYNIGVLVNYIKNDFY